MEHVDHILIVDDDREIRQMVADYLQKNGLRATAVAVRLVGKWAQATRRRQAQTRSSTRNTLNPHVLESL